VTSTPPSATCSAPATGTDLVGAGCGTGTARAAHTAQAADPSIAATPAPAGHDRVVEELCSAGRVEEDTEGSSPTASACAQTASGASPATPTPVVTSAIDTEGAVLAPASPATTAAVAVTAMGSVPSGIAEPEPAGDDPTRCSAPTVRAGGAVRATRPGAAGTSGIAPGSARAARRAEHSRETVRSAILAAAPVSSPAPGATDG